MLYLHGFYCVVLTLMFVLGDCVWCVLIGLATAGGLCLLLCSCVGVIARILVFCDFVVWVCCGCCYCWFECC